MKAANIIKGSVLSAANLFLQIVVAFILTPLMINSLGDHFYGIWVILSSIIGYYGVLDLGISGAVQRFVSRSIGSGDSIEKKYITGTSFYLFGFIGIIIVICTIILGFFVESFVPNQDDQVLIKQVLVLLGLGVGGTFPFRIFTGILNANLRFDISRYIEIFVLILRTAGILYVLKNDGTLLGLAIVTVSSTLLDYGLKFACALKVDKDISVSVKYFDLSKLKSVFSYSAFTFLAQVAKLVSERSGPLVLAKIVSASAVTYYSVAYSFINYFMQLIWSVIGVIGPVFSQDDGRDRRENIVKNFNFSITLCVYISFFCGSISIFYGDQFIYRWLGTEFKSAYQYLIIFMIPMTINLCLAPIYYLLNNISKHKELSCIQMVEAIATLIMSIVLGKYFGPFGVAFGYGIPLLLFSIFVRPFFACKSISLSFGAFYLNIFKKLFVAIMFSVPLWIFFDSYISINYVHIILITVFHGLVFFFGVFRFGLENEEKNIIKRTFLFKKLFDV